MADESGSKQQQIDEARKVLFELDKDGGIVGKSKLYKTYLSNAEAHAQATADFAAAQASALANPATAASWPLLSAAYQQKVDNAYDTFRTEGAEKVEWAIGILASVGIRAQDM